MRFYKLKILTINTFFFLILISCNQATDNNQYYGKPTFNGILTCNIDESQLSSEHILKITAKMTPLYYGFGRISASLNNNWKYIGTDSAIIEPISNSDLDSSIDLIGYFNPNQEFIKEFIFKIPDKDFVNNKLQYFGDDIWGKYDSIYYDKVQKIICVYDYWKYYDNNIENLLDLRALITQVDY